MNYMAAFDISATGMSVEKTRLDVTAVNLANVNSTRSADGGVYKPMRVISGEKCGTDFITTMDALSNYGKLRGAEVLSVEKLDVAPRMVFEPSHPDADQKGFVSYPGVNQVSEMVNLITALRSYEANVVAMNAAKSMALKALEIGGNS